MSQRVISFHYKLTDPTGKLIDSSNGKPPLAYIEGAGAIIPGLERQLTGLKKGDKKIIQVPAAEAYGLKEEARKITVKREEIPAKEVKVGDRFSGGKDAHAPIYRVTQLTDTEVTLDGNHPLAGIDLTFDIDLTDIREATAEEMAHGHAHGEHGHAH